MSSTSQVDRLLTAAKRGDPQALGTLFELHRNYIHFLATAQLHARIRVRASASDIVQDTFLKAHKGFAAFRGKTSGEFVVWLRAIFTHHLQFLLQQHVIAQARDVRREVSLDALGQWVDRSSSRLETVLLASGPTPATTLENHERSLRVADALAVLSEDHREVLLLRSIEGLGFKDVAERMKRSHGAVRMLWLRAIEALRDELREEAK